MAVKTKILRRAEEIAKRNELFSNPLRILVLASIVARGVASWSEVKSDLEELVGPVNPNTLAFHINRLVEAGVVERRVGPRYAARKVPEGLEVFVEEFRGWLNA